MKTAAKSQYLNLHLKMKGTNEFRKLKETYGVTDIDKFVSK